MNRNRKSFIALKFIVAVFLMLPCLLYTSDAADE